MSNSEIARARLRRLECELELEKAHARYTSAMSEALWESRVGWSRRATMVAQARRVLRAQVRGALDRLLEERPECETCWDSSATCGDCAKVSEDDPRIER